MSKDLNQAIAAGITPVVDELVAIQRRLAAIEQTPEFAKQVSDTLATAEALITTEAKSAAFLIAGFSSLPSTTRCTAANGSAIFGVQA